MPPCASSSRTLIQATVDRICPLVALENTFVVTGREWAGLVREQLPEVPPENVIIEPVACNTAPCIALATFIIRQRYWGEDPVMVVLPADHVIRDDEAFGSALQAAVRVAEGDQAAAEVAAGAAGSGVQVKPGAAVAGAAAGTPLPYPLLTLGIWPTRPETGYGYIKMGRLLSNVDGLSVYEAAQFTEKPGAVVAQHFVASGRYLWNSGMFIWRASTIWEAFRRYMPEVYGTLARVEAMATPKPASLAGASAGGAHAAPGPVGPGAPDSSGCGWGKAFDEAYRQLPSISIDYAIMEKARPIITIPCSFGWDEVGSWPALERLLPGDEHGNVVEAGSASSSTRATA